MEVNEWALRRILPTTTKTQFVKHNYFQIKQQRYYGSLDKVYLNEEQVFIQGTVTVLQQGF